MIDRRYPAFGILLVDDEPAWLDSLGLSLERIAGISNTIPCEDSRNVMEILSKNEIGLVLLDLTMPHISGQELLRMISEQYPAIAVIILTGINQIDTAVGCMKLGAFDYFVKTVEEERLVTGVLHAVRMIELQRENREMSKRLLGDSLAHPDAFADIVTCSRAMRALFQYAESIAKSSQPVLITGESGVGKELMARAIHRLGPGGPMISVNVAGLDDNVFSDTLFGHLKGAFTGADIARSGLIEEAAQGTLFLDEIGDLNMASQIKLLRLLTDGEYFPLGSDRPKRMRARIMVATHCNLSAKIAAGQFRRDLFYRLTIHKMHVPPLRNRMEDLPLLVDRFLEEASSDLGKKKPSVPRELIHLLETYNFPGNIRELRSMVYDAVTRHKAGVLSMNSFLEAMGKDIAPALVSGEESGECNIFRGLETLPKPEQAVNLLIDEAMRRAKGNQSLAARLLGMSQSALNKRLKRTEPDEV